MRALLILIAIAGAVWATSLVVPDSLKDRLSAAVGDLSVKQTIINTASQTKEKITDAIIPKSPQEKRAELIARLEQTLEEIEAAQEESAEFTPNPKTKDLIKETKVVVVQLKEENEKDKEGAIRSFLRASTDAISSIGGSEPSQVCNVEE